MGDPAFLTALPLEENTRQPPESHSLRNVLRGLMDKLPPMDLVHQALLNLGLPFSLMQTFRDATNQNIHQGLEKLKVCIHALRVLQKECHRLDILLVNKNNDKKEPISPPKQKRFVREGGYVLPSPFVNQLKIAKKEVQRELFERSCV